MYLSFLVCDALSSPIFRKTENILCLCTMFFRLTDKSQNASCVDVPVVSISFSLGCVGKRGSFDGPYVTSARSHTHDVFVDPLQGENINTIFFFAFSPFWFCKIIWFFLPFSCFFCVFLWPGDCWFFFSGKIGLNILVLVRVFLWDQKFGQFLPFFGQQNAHFCENKKFPQQRWEFCYSGKVYMLGEL